MKAAIVLGANELVVRDVPEPAFGEYEALCELLYGATCTGTDSHIIACTFPWMGARPTILGHESVGRVVKLGAKVRHFRVGDLVTRAGSPPVGEYSVTWGGFAEFGVVRDHWAMAADGLPAEQWKSARVNQIVPHGIDPTVAPMFTTWRETLSWLSRMGNWAGKRVLVAGSGGNGLSYAAHAVLLGASCVAVAGAARLEAAVLAKAGVHRYFDYRDADLAGTINRAIPEGFDLIIDAVGKQGVLDSVLPCLKPGGMLSQYGIDDWQRTSVNPSRARGDFTFHGPGGYDEAETHQQVSELVLQGKLDASLWYDAAKACPLAEIGQAFAELHAHRGVKALIRLRG
jgi:threonine dehydrogenase-like Zn-dependent dehydrogenase